MVNHKKMTFSFPKEYVERLRKLAFVSRRHQSHLLMEALDMLFTTPPQAKHLKEKVQ